LTPLLATDKPVIFKKTFAINDLETLQIQAGAFFGPLLIDGLIDGIWLSNQSDHITAEQVNDIAFELLQSSRCRISKTEYTSCPSCGRTKFDLPKVVRQVKEATQGFVGLKIAVMGCIVNGPGEMADADFGYIGAGMGKVSLYRGKECVMKNIPEEEAIDKLLELINSSKNNK
ncbi:MAG: flavodoxin-dependent (E)-4-hydroxy-3-methylbut-2-enyl-diphosphate synthase, partial [Paludibacteraceae bacterium]|nr:flavodoxin-dependent (E)-4-hydroxy-3-methylbut-2-enyl-diphosphate synthase [Paludibacteraceae bacterium]